MKMHPEITNYWNNLGYILKKNGASWDVYKNNKYIIIIAFENITTNTMLYYKNTTDDYTLSEKEMISHIRLQAFL